MCQLVHHERRPEPVLEDADAVVVLDRFAARPGHLLVIAKDHVEDLTDLGYERYASLHRVVYDACQAVEAALHPVRVFTAALGAPKAVPMSFPHFHLHVIPIFETDERSRPARVFSWADGVTIYDDEEALEMTRRIRASWPNAGRNRPNPVERAPSN